MKKPYRKPTLTEVHIDRTVSLVAGCKSTSTEVAKGLHTCNATACKTVS